MLGDREIHVWRVVLDPSADECARLHALLSPDEAKRAARFFQARHRRRFAVCRGMLRVLLGRYLDCDPRQVAFHSGHKGKPILKPAALHFNVSHSDELALIAFTRSQELGVDVEKLRPMKDLVQLAGRYFSVHEQEAFRALRADQQIEGFFNCWTRKEAVVKATGEGISSPLDAFTVTLAPGEPARVLHPDRTWSLFHQQPAEGYVGALAILGEGWQVVPGADA